MNIEEKLTEIFQDVFDDETLEFSCEISPDLVEDWDSLAHIRLIAAIEKTFHLKFGMEEITIMKSGAAILRALGK